MNILVRIVIVLIAATIGFTALYSLAPRSPSFGMFEGPEGQGILRLVLSFLATIVGVICGSFYRELRKLQNGGATTIQDPRAFIMGMLRSVDLWLGLVGAPIVYALLLRATDGMSLTGLLAVALENGFCCLIVLSGVTSRVEQQNRVG
ncbi:hypothetical protein [Mesorhizobium sp. M1365]|uniref:hypothetical protein n=1 Tax=Mesorhizobium sp. M1365 TaxID=2957090 RepID=UPI0033350EA3